MFVPCHRNKGLDFRKSRCGPYAELRRTGERCCAARWAHDGDHAAYGLTLFSPWFSAVLGRWLWVLDDWMIGGCSGFLGGGYSGSSND